MEKGYGITKKNTLVLGGSIFLLILLFLLLQPRISSLLFSFKRDQLLSNFLTITKETKHINTREFWQVRELYSPGYFTVNKNGIKNANIHRSARFVSRVKEGNLFPFLVFTAPLTQSVDYLTTLTSIEPIVKNFPIEDMDIILQTNTIFLAQKGKEIYLIFLAPHVDLKQTNGFLDYQEKDKELTKEKQWLSLTRFQM